MNRGFQINANIYNLKKTTSPKNAQTTAKTLQNWELTVMHILYINLWTLLTSVAFLWIFLMVSWICLKLSFQWGVTRLYLKKLIMCPFLLQVCVVPVARGTLKNCATKKLLCRSFFYPQWSLLQNAQRKWSIFVK